MISYFSSICGV